MNIILLNSILILCTATVASQAVEPHHKTLDDFKKIQEAGTWISVNDSVMGGISQGGPTFSKKRQLVFSGKISLENNGGFSSIRTRGETMNLSAYDGIEMKVKGDGRMYYLTTRSNGRRMVAFWSPIQPPKGEWSVIRIPFNAFYATYMGKKVPLMKLNTKNISSVGFMLYDKKSGPFTLETDYIRAYKNGDMD